MTRLIRPAAIIAVAGLLGGVLAAAPAGAAPAAGAAAVPTAGVTVPPVNPSALNMVPKPMGGLVDVDATRTQTTIRSTVWALRQAGTKMFAGGMFTGVKANAASPTVGQASLAAFDVSTGEWDPTCRPAFDNAVYSLATLPSGLLAVGGEFTTVNGMRTPGLVVLDPATCALVPNLPVELGRPFSTLRPVVRTLRVVGDDLYIGGNFSRIIRRGTSVTSPTPIAGVTGCAVDGGVCKIPSGRTADVWFGADSRWVQKAVAYGQVPCDTATFGDPAPGAVKSCYFKLDGGTATSVFKVARVRISTATVDQVFKPQVMGMSVWDLAVDPARNRVHLAGMFSGIGAIPDTANWATVDASTGAYIAGQSPRLHVDAAFAVRQGDVYSVDMGAPDKIFRAGAQHVLEMLDADTSAQRAYAHTGFICPAGQDQFYLTLACSPWRGGGDYQVARKVGDYVFAGCHCTRYTNNDPAHYSSVTGAYTTHHNLMAYDASTMRLVDSFEPDIDGAVEGAWAVSSDTLGCLYIGGDYTKGGLRAKRPVWLSGVARLCPGGAPPSDTQAPTAPKAVQAADVGAGAIELSWNASSDNVGVHHYHVAATNGAAVDVPGAPATLTGVGAGSTSVSVTAVDAAGNVSAAGVTTVEVGRAGADTVSPTAPRQLQSSTAAGVTVSWAASSDNVRVRNYIIYRNGAYVGWSPTTTWTDPAPPPGSRLEYRVRAVDTSGNNSVKSEAILATTN